MSESKKYGVFFVVVVVVVVFRVFFVVVFLRGWGLRCGSNVLM